MWSSSLFCMGAAVASLGLAGCSGGDLTLPGGDQPAEPRPASIIVLSGDGQLGAPGALLGEPLTVRVADDSSRPVPDTPVKFSFLGNVSGAALDPTTPVLTDVAGLATATLRLGEVPGEQIVVAEVVDTQPQILRARFTVTAVDPGKGGGGKGRDHGGNGQSDED
ncbi:MAG: hypothetical protein ACREOQ_03795 [Gemmatimonadales bacterium]